MFINNYVNAVIYGADSLDIRNWAQYAGRNLTESHFPLQVRPKYKTMKYKRGLSKLLVNITLSSRTSASYRDNETGLKPFILLHFFELLILIFCLNLRVIYFQKSLLHKSLQICNTGHRCNLNVWDRCYVTQAAGHRIEWDSDEPQSA